jgi:copper resistance protein C
LAINPEAERITSLSTALHASVTRPLPSVGCCDVRTSVALTALVDLATASTVAPHALLLESTPVADTVVIAPSRLVLRFNGRLESRLSSVMLIGGPRQTRVLLIKNEVTPEQRDMLIYTLPPLEPGRYRVEWKALSVDGHVTNGLLRFEVVAPSAASPAR